MAGVGAVGGERAEGNRHYLRRCNIELSSVEYITRKPLPWKETLLMPLGDIQLQQDRNAVDVKRLKETIKFGVERDAWWFGGGDFIDMESPSNRRALQNSGVYDSVIDALDSKAEELEDELKDILKPTVGRWLGLLEGHHYHPHSDGTTTDTRMAQYLKAPFLGTSAYINVSFKAPGNHGAIGANIWTHHGRGGGGLAGSPTNALEKKILGFDADIYCMFHTHTLGAVPRDRVYPVWGRTQGSLHHKRLYLVTCGAFLKGYEERSRRNGRAGGGYAEKAMMNPLALGSARIWFRPTWKTDLSRSGYPALETTVEV